MKSEDVSEEDTAVFEDYMQRKNMVSRMIPKFLAQEAGWMGFHGLSPGEMFAAHSPRRVVSGRPCELKMPLFE